MGMFDFFTRKKKTVPQAPAQGRAKDKPVVKYRGKVEMMIRGYAKCVALVNRIKVKPLPRVKARVDDKHRQPGYRKWLKDRMYHPLIEKGVAKMVSGARYSVLKTGWLRLPDKGDAG